MKYINLTKGYRTKVDDEDYLKLLNRKWQVQEKAFCRYASTSIQKNGISKTVRMHRLILGVLPGFQVDHINGDGLDNRKCNLRICDNSQNNQAFRVKRLNTDSKFRGVHWDKGNKRWRAEICVFYRKKKLGRFRNEVDAAKAYDIAAKKYFGEFAQQNL